MLMLIISNCFRDAADEGCVKVAASLAKQIKKRYANITVVSFDRSASIADRHLELNKFFLSWELKKILSEEKGRILYIPFPAKSFSIAVRTMMLSLLGRRRVDLLLSMAGSCSLPAAWLFKCCGTRIYTLSGESEIHYGRKLGKNAVTILKTGVDTERFVPVAPHQVRALKGKYGLDPDRKVILHVGHLKHGRNIAQLCKLDSQYQILLVVSTLTKDQRDRELRAQLEQCGNVKILDQYISQIQEVYQLADAYFFPVESHSHCIDVPLSVLEAAACGKPVVTTAFGELQQMQGKQGFYFIESFEPEALNCLVEKALADTGGESRKAVLAYDWKHAAGVLFDEE